MLLPSSAAATGNIGTDGSQRILVVEDDRHLADVVARHLGREGFAVEVVHDVRTRTPGCELVLHVPAGVAP